MVVVVAAGSSTAAGAGVASGDAGCAAGAAALPRRAVLTDCEVAFGDVIFFEADLPLPRPRAGLAAGGVASGEAGPGAATGFSAGAADLPRPRRDALTSLGVAFGVALTFPRRPAVFTGVFTTSV